jgi:hypothetical protein
MGRSLKGRGSQKTCQNEIVFHKTRVSDCGHKNCLRIKKGHPQAEKSVWGFFVGFA